MNGHTTKGNGEGLSDEAKQHDENEARHEVWERAHELGSPTYRLRRRLVLKLADTLPPSSGAACLDAGCGTGDFAVELALRGWRVSAFDPSPHAIELALKRARAAGVELDCEECGVEQFEPREKFSLILSVDVLEHIEDDVGALRRLADWLAPGGVLLLTVPADASLWSAADEFSGHFRRYSSDLLSRRLGAAGLHAEKFVSYGFPMTRLMWRMKARVPEAEGWMIGSGGRQAAPAFASKALARSAVLLTSVDRLFTNSNRGVGLAAIARRRDG